MAGFKSLLAGSLAYLALGLAGCDSHAPHGGAKRSGIDTELGKPAPEPGKFDGNVPANQGGGSESTERPADDAPSGEPGTATAVPGSVGEKNR